MKGVQQREIRITRYAVYVSISATIHANSVAAIGKARRSAKQRRINKRAASRIKFGDEREGSTLGNWTAQRGTRKIRGPPHAGHIGCPSRIDRYGQSLVSAGKKRGATKVCGIDECWVDYQRLMRIVLSDFEADPVFGQENVAPGNILLRTLDDLVDDGAKQANIPGFAAEYQIPLRIDARLTGSFDFELN